MERTAEKTKRRDLLGKSIQKGTGCVLADLGFEDAADMRVRVQLAVEVNRVLDTLALPQNAIGDLLGIGQPQVSNLRTFKLDRFSSDRLMRFLTLLNRDVEIVIRERKRMESAGKVAIKRTT